MRGLAGLDKETKQLARLAEDQGFVVDLSRSGHVRFRAPDGQVIFGATTPSDPRSIKNLRSHLRRHGLVDRPVKRVKPVVKAPPPPPVRDPLDEIPLEVLEELTRPFPWGHWTDKQVRDLKRQGYSAAFIKERTGR